MKRDLVTMICYICIFLSIIIVASYIVTERISSCTADPLSYAVDKLKRTTDAVSVSGTITMQTPKGSMISDTFGDGFAYVYNKTDLFTLTD